MVNVVNVAFYQPVIQKCKLTAVLQLGFLALALHQSKVENVCMSFSVILYSVIPSLGQPIYIRWDTLLDCCQCHDHLTELRSTWNRLAK